MSTKASEICNTWGWWCERDRHATDKHVEEVAPPTLAFYMKSAFIHLLYVSFGDLSLYSLFMLVNYFICTITRSSTPAKSLITIDLLNPNELTCNRRE